MPTDAPKNKVDVCNLALIQLKQKLISNIDKPSKGNVAESICAEVYENCRQATLRRHPVNFAIKRITLAADSEAPEFGFTHAFALPNDFLRYLSRHDANGVRIFPESPNEKYQIESGKYLISTESPGTLRIRYIFDNQAITTWDPLFIQLLAINIAVKIAPNFSGITNQTMARIKKEQLDLRTDAQAIDGQERPPIRVERSKIIQARQGFGRGNVASPFTIFD